MMPPSKLRRIPSCAPGKTPDDQRLAALQRLAVLDTPAEPVYDDLTVLAARCCAVPAAMIALVDRDRLWFKSSHGVPMQQRARYGSLCERVLTQDEFVQIEDTSRAAVSPEVLALPAARIARFYAGAPIRLASGHTVGVLAVVDYQPRRLDPAQRDNLTRLARQVAEALQAREAPRALLAATQKLQRQAAFNALHARASQVIAASAQEQPMLQAICDAAVQHGNVRLALVARPGIRGTFEFIASAGDTDYLEQLVLHVDPGHALGNGPTALAWRSGTPQFTDSVPAAAELEPWRERARRFGLRSNAVVPVLRGGKVWAVFSAYLGETGVFDAESREIVQELALNLSQGLDRIDSAQREQELAELQRILLDNTLAGILIKRDSRIVSMNRQLASMLGIADARQTEGLPTRSLYADDAECERVDRLHAELLREGQVRAMDVRIRRSDGSERLCDIAAGVVRKGAPGTTVWTFVDVSERSRLQRKLRHEALHDALSELPNRRALEEYLPGALARARRTGSVLAVGLIDLDDFKSVNDSLGHEAGDELLRSVAQRLSDQMRKGDMLARLGGDEFVVVLEDLDEGDPAPQLESIMARLRRAIDRPFQLAREQSARVEMTVGLAAYPAHGSDGEALLRQADAALYQLKERKLTRSNWWQLGLRDAQREAAGEAEHEAQFDAYGPDADALLRSHGGVLRQAVARFAQEYRRRLDRDGEPSRLLGCLHEGELQRACRHYCEHLDGLLAQGLTAEAVDARAQKLGQLQALLGIEAARLIPPSAMLRRIAMQCALAAHITSTTRYRLLRLLEERLEDDLQAQLRASNQLTGRYFQALTHHDTLDPGTTWRDIVRALLDPVGGLPGVQSCLVLRPNAHDVFEIEAAVGLLADRLVAAMRSGDFTIPLRPQDADGQDLVAAAWRSHELQSSADVQRDGRAVRWHRAARDAQVRSAAAVPITPVSGRCAMVVVLLGRHPNQFEAPWMRQFLRGLQSRASHAWRNARTPATSAVLARDLAQAYRDRLFSGGLQMHLQPIVDLYTGQCTKVEALARLRLQDGSMVPPARFLPVLGDSELDRLFRVGLAQVCEQLQQWDRTGMSIDFALNLPPTTLLDPQCPQWVEETLSRYAIDPGRLTLELLETQEVEFQSQDRALRNLKALGVRLAMDDLGAGYSSLQRLSQLPFDVIKLDQSIALNMRKQPLQALSLMRSVVRLAEELGRVLVVEGVEDRGVIEAALQSGGRHAQGYGIARPMPASLFPAWRRDFRLAASVGEIRTYLGMLARCSTLRQPARVVLPQAERDPIPRFLGERGEGRGEVARWYAALSPAQPGESPHDGTWWNWLVGQVRAEATEDGHCRQAA